MSSNARLKKTKKTVFYDSRRGLRRCLEICDDDGDDYCGGYCRNRLHIDSKILKNEVAFSLCNCYLVTYNFIVQEMELSNCMKKELMSSMRRTHLGCCGVEEAKITKEYEVVVKRIRMLDERLEVVLKRLLGVKREESYSSYCCGLAAINIAIED